MNKEHKKILVADSDPKIIHQLRDPVSKRGMELITAYDGPKALELAISFRPDIILMDISLPILSSVKIGQILKSNPNLSNVPIVLMNSGGSIKDFPLYLRAATINKPFNVEEVMIKIDNLLLKVNKAKEVVEEPKDIEGNLAQMSLVDILQLLSMNKKDGVVIVKKEGKKEGGSIFFRGGRIINATTGTVKGEKALYRLLARNTGKFEYLPKNFTQELNIDKTTDSLLMEGMRQLDEWRRMAGNFPSGDSNLHLKIASDKISAGLNHRAKEILALLEFYRKVDDLLNACSYSDYEAMMTIHTLTSKGILEARGRDIRGKKMSAPFLTAGEVFAIKEKLKAAFGERGRMHVTKIPLFFNDPSDIKKIVNILTAIDGFALDGDFLLEAPSTIAFSSIGRINASEDVTLLFIALPMQREYSPLWRPLIGSGLGAVILRGLKTDADNMIDFIKELKSSFHMKSAVITIDKSLPALTAREAYQINLWEVKSENAIQTFKVLISSFFDTKVRKEFA